jgi:hypothetical protein
VAVTGTQRAWIQTSGGFLLDGEPSGAWDDCDRFKHTPIGNRETPQKEGLGADDRSIQAAGTQVIARWIAHNTAPGALMLKRQMTTLHWCCRARKRG